MQGDNMQGERVFVIYKKKDHVQEVCRRFNMDIPPTHGQADRIIVGICFRYRNDRLKASHITMTGHGGTSGPIYIGIDENVARTLVSVQERIELLEEARSWFARHPQEEVAHG